MFTIDTYLPTRVIFGYGRLNELKNLKMPGKKALICVTADGLMEKLGLQQKMCIRDRIRGELNREEMQITQEEVLHLAI